MIKKITLEFENYTNNNEVVVEILKTLAEDIQDGTHDLDGPGKTDWAVIERYDEGYGEFTISSKEGD